MADHHTASQMARLHAAVARYCRLQGDSQAHHRAIIDDIRSDTRNDRGEGVAWYIEHFETRVRDIELLTRPAA